MKTVLLAVGYKKLNTSFKALSTHGLKLSPEAHTEKKINSSIMLRENNLELL